MKKFCRFSILMLTVMLLFFIRSCNGQSLYRCSWYRDAEITKKIPTTIAVSGDSVMTYVYDYGYIWWKIESYEMKITDQTTLIESGKFYLINRIGKSYLVINNKLALQLITVQSKTFTIEFLAKR